MFTGSVIVPATLYLYLAHPAWSWMYLVDPATVPGLAVIPVLVVHGGMIVATWYIGGRLVRVDKRRIVLYLAAGTGSFFVACGAILQARLRHYSSYDGYHAGDSLGLMKVKLGYVLVALVLGLGVSVAFVVLELLRDSRKVRAR
jgi:hypothetical protein